MRIRPATAADAPAISALLAKLVAAGKRTSPSDTAFVLSHYINDPNGVSTFLAEDNTGTLLGFQALTVAGEGNAYGTPAGWGFIGTHVSPDAGRQGVGKGLFSETQIAGGTAKLTDIEACIGANNVEGQAYYEAIGFRTYRLIDGAVCKRYHYTR